MGQKTGGGVITTQTITWSGLSLKTASPIIDARTSDAYFTMPFVAGTAQLYQSVTADSNVGGIRILLYNDAEQTDFVGFYWFNNETITSNNKTDLNCPRFKFDTRIKIAPRGYYFQFQLARQSNTYVDNDAATTYFNTYGNTVDLVS